ncbi:hypothetical protein [Deinococcus yavapaiensis]|uniref:Uncharacterized protein n=1 Tax=Deinococcus yavapaiensis KR-236 TaxID=694435 RepID=A0A318SEN0_9DEIO|nr:hypothetical protein [Deinococcus yavapaiensis]PYE51198.1 hypothetical protein DES52_115130 [Deinococcus yavapaiensis KR-236]
MKRTSNALALLAMLALGTTQAQLLEQATPQERELLQRALGISDAAQFMPGALPAEIERDFGASLKTLPNLRVIGSVVQGAPSNAYGPYIQSHLVTTARAAHVEAVMTAALRQTGWQDKDSAVVASSRNAFTSGSVRGVPVTTYLKGERHLSYFSSEHHGTTSVTLSMDRELSTSTSLALLSSSLARPPLANDGASNSAPPGGRRTPFANGSLPRLAPPPDARVRETGSRASTDFAKDTATIFTSGSAEHVFDHYVEELRKAGWRLTGREVRSNGEVVASFDVRFQERDLQGRLSMTSEAIQPGRFDVRLESFGR